MHPKQLTVSIQYTDKPQDKRYLLKNVVYSNANRLLQFL